MAKLKSPSELETLRSSIIQKRDPNKPCITICNGTGCQSYGGKALTESFRNEIKKQNLESKVDIRVTGCHGFCERGPLVIIKPTEILYQRVRIKDVPEIVSETAVNNKVIERMLYTDKASNQKIASEKDVPFYKLQKRLIFGNNGLIDPTSIEDYLAVGGYTALTKAIKMTPENVIEEVKKSGLRGRGGAGFPTGSKWESTRNAEGDVKYVICNADEGDPGAFMDRSLAEGNPHSVLEGMVIGAYAIGSHEGFIYIRNEYPLAVRNMTTAIEQAEANGLLGDNILGSGFSFKIKIKRGGGAFVCGESTALMASLEGRVGEPRAKYIHTSEQGLWGKPSNLNNVETWANIPLIISKGADWYSQIGTTGSKGTKIFALTGNITNSGLVEVPMGIKLREIIFDIGGGIPKGRKFKAVQTGGPSGGMLPENMLDLSVDFDELTKAGSMMGSGGMIVMDEKTCMVDMARYYTTFLEGESCGKCVPCREGLRQMKYILDGITQGRGKEGDIELLEELCATLLDASLCQLGQSAPNPVLSSIKYFRDEYEAHIKEKKCPSGVCKIG
ncbi:MAG: NADH-ubiquinone oxidoreductase-F iron-sulfur binding region domain-containing protein [Dehalococcoidales bacterium]|nr:NADH-ubiquinone oxidoreductase-F iron-sulfur binding region domain-containing protein [Dehalococcoidales bacterium]